MEGYHNNPEATAEAIDADGWLHTGDIGELDERGFLRITDRKKDLFKTSGGKYVAPSAIEATFKGLCPYASQLIVEGAERNFVSALVTLDPDAIQGWAAANGLGGKSYPEIAGSPQAREMVQGYVDQLNAGLNRWETVKRFSILERDLTIEEGELTPSLKLRARWSPRGSRTGWTPTTRAEPALGSWLLDERDEQVVPVLGHRDLGADPPSP